jgi:hypothetical protein
MVVKLSEVTFRPLFFKVSLSYLHVMLTVTGRVSR